MIGGGNAVDSLYDFIVAHSSEQMDLKQRFPFHVYVIREQRYGADGPLPFLRWLIGKTA